MNTRFARRCSPRAQENLQLDITFRAAITRLLATCAIALVAPAVAQSANTNAQASGTPTLAISRHVIASGGGASSGAVFAISGTIAQADADPLQPSTGGVFAITGGFWPGAPIPAAPVDGLFANGFETGPL
jgi:hypothetical protein